jgi:hypothetical protein
MKLKDEVNNAETIVTVSTGMANVGAKDMFGWDTGKMLSNKEQARRPRLSASVSSSPELPRA